MGDNFEVLLYNMRDFGKPLSLKENNGDTKRVDFVQIEITISLQNDVAIKKYRVDF